MRHPSLSEEEEEIGRIVVDSLFAGHRELGPGLIERIYEACLEHEIRSRKLRVDRQIPVEIH